MTDRSDASVLLVPHGFESNYTAGLVRGLCENGVALRVVTSDADDARLAELGVATINLRGSLSPDRSPFAKVLNLTAYYVRLTMLALRRRHATIHFSGVFRDELLIVEGLWLSILFRVFAESYVYTVHNVLPHGKSNSRFYRQVYRILYRLPHVLVAHGEYSAQMLRREFNVPPERIHILPIGLNEEVPITGMTRVEARRVLGINQDARVVLFFGRIHPTKGPDLLIRAVPSVKIDGLTLVVAGECLHPSYLAEVEGLLSALTARVRVVLHAHFIPNEAVERYFASADVLALPYREISQSGVPLLALAFGLPMIATDVGSMREYVDARSGIIVPSNNVPRLADALDRFFECPRDFDREAIARDARRYAWGKVAQDLAMLYRRMRAAR